MGHTKLYAKLAATAVVAFLSFVSWKIFLAAPDDQFSECRSATVAGGVETIGGPFELVSGTGETVTDKDVITEPTLIYFGYTFCPNICPFDVIRNADAVDILASRGLSTTPVMITIDPNRDTPEVMADFTGNVHEKMIGLSGSPEQVDAVSKAYKTYYKINDDGTEDYTVDHTTLTYLVLPEKGTIGIFQRELSEKQLADQVQCFLERL